MRRALVRARAITHIAVVWALARLFGISVVVRYLRRPEPLATSRLLRAFGAQVGRTPASRARW